MRTNMCMSRQYISFSCFEKIVSNIDLCLCRFRNLRFISKVDLVLGKKEREKTSLFVNKLGKWPSVDHIQARFLCKASIPKIKVSPLCLTFTNSLQERISLSHNIFIFTFELGKLSKCTRKDWVQIVSSNWRCKVKKIHIKRWKKHRTIGKILPILGTTYFSSLDKIFFSTSMSFCRIFLGSECWCDRKINRIRLIAWSLKIVKLSSRRKVKGFKYMCLSWTIFTDNRCSRTKWYRFLLDSAKLRYKNGGNDGMELIHRVSFFSKTKCLYWFYSGTQNGNILQFFAWKKSPNCSERRGDILFFRNIDEERGSKEDGRICSNNRTKKESKRKTLQTLWTKEK